MAAHATDKIPGTEEAWESGQLGADEEHVKVAPTQEQQLDAALDLHPISIRLQRGLLDNLKAIAQLNGIGYQPLIRQVLTRFVDGEIRSMLASRVAEERSLVPPSLTADKKLGRPPRERAKKAA